MPPARGRLYGRDDVDPSSVGPGQRVSIDGGIDSSKNIIAMILATVLFIVVVVSYQYFSITITRREEARRRTGSRHGHRRTRSAPRVPLTTRLRALIRRWMTFLKLVVSPPAKPAPSTSSTSSTEALLKKITPRRTPKRRTLFNLPRFVRQKEQPRSKRESRRALRPLLLNNEAMYTYTPRSPIDKKTQELLRSPDAFAEFSDPVRNMNFVRVQDEVQLRKERGEIWYEEPLNSPEIPSVACIAPLALRKKCSLLREGDKTDDEQAPIERSPGRVIYPPPPIVVPATPPSTVDVDEKQNVTYYPSYDTTRPLSIIEEEDPDSPAPRSFFEICGDEDDDELCRRKIRLRFPLPSPIKASLQNDIDVFSIGSFSVSEESSDGSGH